MRTMGAVQRWSGQAMDQSLTNLGIASELRIGLPHHCLHRVYLYGRPDAYEGESESLQIAALMAESGVFLDVGAHLGYYSWYVAARAREARVYAFEAAPLMAEYLAANLRRNPNWPIQLVHAAVSREAGIRDFHVDPAGGLRSSLLPGFAEGARAVSVPTLSLDQWTQQQGIDPRRVFAKIDVEGAELEVIEGAAALAGQCRGLLIEILRPYKDSGLIEALCSRHGLDGYYVAGEELIAVDRFESYQAQQYNWLFLRRGDTAAVERLSSIFRWRR